MHKILILISGFFLSTFVFAANNLPTKTSAETIALYEQPNADAKVIETIKSDQALIPIFNQDDWIKVGDPTNGNVGWINNKTLETLGMPRIYVKTFSQNEANKNGKGFQLIQYSGSQAFNEKQMQDMIKRMQQQQVMLQKNFNSMLQQSITDFNNLAKQLQQ